MKPLVDNYGPWALVTGASDGIGMACARELANAGFHLAVVARREDRLEALASELSEKHGIEVRVLAADLSKPESVPEIIAKTKDLDIGVFLSAAGFGTSGSFLSISLEDELQMLDVNCRASLMLTRELSARFVERRKKGAVVLFSSLVGFQGVPRAAHYAATKAYIQVLGEGLQRELKPLGIDLLIVAPGPVKSGFGARAGMQMGMAGDPAQVARAIIRSIGRSTTLRPNLLSKFLEFSLTFLGRRGRTLVLERVMQDMTKSHN